MKLFVKSLEGLVLPTRANKDDAAYDIVAIGNPNVVGSKVERYINGFETQLWSKIDYVEYKTGLYVAPQIVKEIFAEPFGLGKIVKFHLEGFARSSISKKNLVLANSVATLDNGYRGEICFRFKYILQPEDLVILTEPEGTRIYAKLKPENIYQKGDKIAQIKPRIDTELEFEVVESLDATTRGEGGFGSSGK